MQDYTPPEHNQANELYEQAVVLADEVHDTKAALKKLQEALTIFTSCKDGDGIKKVKEKIRSLGR
jgi:hypothetical protein